VSLTAAGVYRHASGHHPANVVAAVAAATRHHTDTKASASAAAGAIAAATGAAVVALIVDRGPLVVRCDGHDLRPLSPEASAALQGDPARTRVVDVPVTSMRGPVSLMVVGPLEGDLHGAAETLGLALDLAATRQEAARAERLAALKSDFAAVVGHEIRSPLASIIGALQTVEKLGTADQKTLELVRGASARADRLRTLVEDLLMTARIDGRGVPVRPRLLCVVDMSREVAGPAGIPVTSTGRVPSVKTDGDHVRRILTNLIENAATHAAGSPVEVSVRELDDGVEITIADHGPGLPPEVASDPFSGSHDSSTGLGLGLKIAAGLAEAVGGTLGHRPTRGGGASFLLTLPLEI